jgi:hypothetical protein
MTPLVRMAHQTGPPYQFKLLGSVYAYSGQTWFYRAMIAVFAVWVAGLILVGLNEFVGWLVVFASVFLGSYVMETGHSRGKTLS